MALSSENKDAIVNLGKSFIKKAADNIKTHIEAITSSSDPKQLGDSFDECDKSVAEITFRLNQLKKTLKPTPGISN
jgi:hypothetical protein